MKFYQTLSRNEKIEVSAAPEGATILLHVERWNGSYEVTVTSKEVLKDKVTITDTTGQRHTVHATMPVWIRERVWSPGVEENG